MKNCSRSSAALALSLTILMPLECFAVDSLPVDQTLTFPQLSQPVDVVRDAFGIPHFYATAENDAAFAVGYIQATDRLFQMDLNRKIASGRMSELLGFPDFQVDPFPGNLANVFQDIFLQTLGLRRAAVDSLAALPADIQSALQAYADGINEYVDFVNQTGNLPPEYASIGISEIEPWTPIDSVAMAKLLAFQLSFDFDDGLTEDLAEFTAALGESVGSTAFFEDVNRAQPTDNAFTVPDAAETPIALTALSIERDDLVAASETTPSAAAPLIAEAVNGRDEICEIATDATSSTGEASSHDADPVRDAAESARTETLRKAHEYVAQLLRQPALRAVRERGARGSNEWAVDGSLTDSGVPLIANDPHLSLGNPANFYELHINTKDRGGEINVTGVTFAGAGPAVVIGHNENIAWGATVNPSDATDWYLEEISSDGAGNLFSTYLGNPEPITELPLEIKVNFDTGNEEGGDRDFLEAALGLDPGTATGIVDVSSLLEVFVPAKILIVDRHGPIFPQTLQPFPVPPNHTGGSAVSTQYTGLYATRELETFFLWNRAENLDDFKEGLKFFDFGGQNWAYADTAGNIGYFSKHEIPIREDIDAGALVGNPPWLIRDGTGGNEWKALAGPQPDDQAVPFEIVPFDEMPGIENPPAGFFVNANNDPIGNTADNDPLDEALAGTGPYLNVGYSDTRAARITELIQAELGLIPTPPGTPAGDGLVSFADMERMQADVNQLEGRRLSGYFVSAVDNAQAMGAPAELSALVNSTIIDARDRLAAWSFNTPAGFDTPGDPGVPSGQDLIDSVATTIYNVAVGRLIVNTFDATLDANGISYRQGSAAGHRSLLRLLGAAPFTGIGASGLNFFDAPGVSLSAAQERDFLLVQSLQDALDLLAGGTFAGAFGNSTDVDDYLWGKVHYIIFESALNGELNGVEIPGGGAFSIPPQPSASFPPGAPADGARFTVDVANYGLRPDTETGLSFGSGANRRSIVEMTPGAIVAKNVIPGGTDGVVGRTHYGDQIDLWLGNGYHDEWIYTADVVADAKARILFDSLPGCTASGIGQCAPGKGSAATDCLGEFFVDAPFDETILEKSQFDVTDGGGSDFDGAANGECRIHLLFCINNSDPRLPECQSTDIAAVELKKPRLVSKRVEEQDNAAVVFDALTSLGPSTITGKKGNVIEFDPALTDGDRCVAAYLRVPLKKGTKPGKAVLKATYITSTGTRDKDSLKRVCRP